MEVDGAETPVYYEIWDYPGKSLALNNIRILLRCAICYIHAILHDMHADFGL
jgi:hypothetical protein